MLEAMSEPALLEAIQATPGDRAVREVYADWLEQRGDPRATWIRAHLAVLAVTPDHPVRWEREEELGRARLGLDPAWLAVLDPPVAMDRGCECFTPVRMSKKGNPVFGTLALHAEIQDTTTDAWKRICDAIEVGYVRGETELDLRGAPVVTLPRAIGKLTTLRRLRLYGSHISRLPREIGLLPELTELTPYTSYRLHYYPYELARAPVLRSSTVSTRALYGNFKFRPPFPLLAPTQVALPPRPCSICDAMFEDRGRYRYWTSRRVASDVMPLLINACSSACLANALPPSERYLPRPHRGGPGVQQPAPI